MIDNFIYEIYVRR